MRLCLGSPSAGDDPVPRTPSRRLTDDAGSPTATLSVVENSRSRFSATAARAKHRCVHCEVSIEIFNKVLEDKNLQCDVLAIHGQIQPPITFVSFCKGRGKIFGKEKIHFYSLIFYMTPDNPTTTR